MTFKTITFPNVERADDDKIEIARKSMIKSNCRNGLYKILQFGYCYHIPITIRPDDILNNVVSIWSKYVVLNSEKFRDIFVNHEGKKKLTYFAGGAYSDGRIEEITNGLIALMIKDQGNDKVLWASKCCFSTTTYIDKMVRVVATLASQKKYYSYGATFMCGFPEIRLEGTEDDWNNLADSVRLMPDLDDKIISWKESLINIIRNMIDGSEDFWQSCMTSTRYGSGGQQSRTGWVLAFNPINEKGEWLKNIEDNDYLDLENTVTVNINDNGDVFDLKIRSGPVSVGFVDKKHSSLVVTNKNHFYKIINKTQNV